MENTQIQANRLFESSVNIFKTYSDSRKTEAINEIKSYLAKHRNAILNIGIGYAEAYVIAAKRFLKEFDK